MSFLYYSNLPGITSPEIFMQRANSGFWPFSSYLYQSIKTLEKERLIVKIRLISQEEEKILIKREEVDPDEEKLDEEISKIIDEEAETDEEIENNKDIEVKIRIKYWYELNPTSSDVENIREVMDEFLKQRFVYDNEKCERYKGIRVIDRKIKKNRIALEKTPNGDYLYITFNTYPLRCQLKAVQTLMSKPLPHHLPLLTLIDRKDFVNWPRFPLEEITDDEWSWLDSKHLGTERQKEFVKIALSTPNFALLEGPPGTGKTITICEIIMQYIKRGKRVLLCASTHVAVDNVLENFVDKGFSEINPVRVGDPINLSEKILKFQYEIKRNTLKKELLEFLGSHNKLSAQKYLYEILKEDKKNALITNIILDNANLVCGTTVGFLKHPMIWNQQKQWEKTFSGVKPLFDVLIVDEASKTTFQEFLIPALYAKKWIIVGDPKQLSPYVETKEVESNLIGLMDETEEKICNNLFQIKQNKRNIALINILNDESQIKYIEQANKLDIPYKILENRVSFNDLIKYQLLFGINDSVKRYEKILPPDISLTVDLPHLPLFKKRQKVFENKSRKIKDYKSKWEKELTWRLVREYELRNKPDEQIIYKEQIESLKPYWEGSEKVRKNLAITAQVALPSILESLKEGIKIVSRSNTTLSDGFSEDYLIKIHKLLEYQHRMHPDISKFPARHFYENKSLLNVPDASELRNWKYTRYSSRSVWIHVPKPKYDKTKRKEERRRNTRSEREAEIILNELREFMDFARRNEPPEIGSGLWEVAILTFYLDQESLLREMLRKELKSGAYQNFWLKKQKIHISLCTVDRFQGHEADIVFLSLVRNDKIGFLNSPNRLNVSITRAKYQLVILGNKDFFKNQPYVRIKSYYLQKLAEETPLTILYT